MPSLRRIDLSNCAHFWNQKELATSLIDFICLQGSVEELDLSQNNFSPFVTGLLFDRMIDSPLLCRSLKRIELDGTVRVDYDEECWEKLAKFILQAPKVANQMLGLILDFRFDLAEKVFKFLRERGFNKVRPILQIRDRKEWWQNEACAEQMIAFICEQVNLAELSLVENNFSLQTTTTVLAMLAESPNTVSIRRLDLRDSAKYSREADEDRTLEAFIDKAPHLIFSLLRPSTANLMYEGVTEYLRTRIASEK